VKIPQRRLGVKIHRAKKSQIAKKLLLPAEEYLHNEALTGGFLIGAAILALAWMNSPWAETYQLLIHSQISIRLGGWVFDQDLKHWVNDGLMTLFFFLVALEIKRELHHGSLSEKRKAALPFFAAFGGMFIPVGIYLLLNYGETGSRGWGIPMATDIAFATSILALLGSNVPATLKIFLLSYAIVDDIGAILAIAVFYTENLSLPALGVAGALILIIFGMRQVGVTTIAAYILPGLLFWYALFESGVHATMAGVILGFMTPVKSKEGIEEFTNHLNEQISEIEQREKEEPPGDTDLALGKIEESLRLTESPLHRLERHLRPYVSFLVLPIFAFVNSGIQVSGQALSEAVTNPVAQGVVLGLVVGKIVGTSLFAWIALWMGVARLPDSVQLRHIVGAGLVGGIGFTVSLFITELAFTEEKLILMSKMGILAASLICALAGLLYFWIISLTRNGKQEGEPKKKDDKQD
jgi:Na+:H+ antiporter, NhaA family